MNDLLVEEKKNNRFCVEFVNRNNFPGKRIKKKKNNK